MPSRSASLQLQLQQKETHHLNTLIRLLIQISIKCMDKKSAVVFHQWRDNPFRGLTNTEKVRNRPTYKWPHIPNKCDISQLVKWPFGEWTAVWSKALCTLSTFLHKPERSNIPTMMQVTWPHYSGNHNLDMPGLWLQCIWEYSQLLYPKGLVHSIFRIWIWPQPG